MTSPYSLIRPLLLLIVTACLSLGALADTLTIQGPDREVVLTQQEVLALGEKPLTTTTPWTEGEHIFEGASLASVLALAGIEEGKVVATALDGYTFEVPLAAAFDAGAYVAVSQDGELMQVREKGPFWIIFPWSERPELVNREIRNWAVWHLARLKVTD